MEERWSDSSEKMGKLTNNHLINCYRMICRNYEEMYGIYGAMHANKSRTNILRNELMMELNARNIPLSIGVRAQGEPEYESIY